MPEEPKITMSEFKVVLESVEAKLQIVAEGVQLANEKMDREFAAVKKDIRHLTDRVDSLNNKMDSDFHSVKEQLALLHEGQTEIKNELTQKINRDEFSKLEVRVARLESKVA